MLASLTLVKVKVFVVVLLKGVIVFFVFFGLRINHACVYRLLLRLLGLLLARQ